MSSDAKHKPARTLRLPRAEWLIALTLALVALLVGWLCVKVVSQDRDLRSSGRTIDALASQVQSLGGTPVAGASGLPGRPGQDATGSPGAKGEKGDPGPSSTIPGPSGSPGATGPAGQPGADSTVPGPSGQPGESGESGAAGQNGQDGSDGSDGQNCPDGYSLQPDPNDPDNLVCRRDGATASPTPSPTPTDSPSPSESPSGLLPITLLDRRRD